MDDLDRAQLAAYNKLKNSKAFAVIYAVSLGRGKIFINPPQLKNSQAEVQHFIAGFKKTPNSMTNATAYVFYRDQLNKIADSLKSRGLLKEDLTEADDQQQLSGKVKIVNASKPFDGLDGEILEESNDFVTVRLNFPTSNGNKLVVQDFSKDQIERI